MAAGALAVDRGAEVELAELGLRRGREGLRVDDHPHRQEGEDRHGPDRDPLAVERGVDVRRDHRRFLDDLRHGCGGGGRRRAGGGGHLGRGRRGRSSRSAGIATTESERSPTVLGALQQVLGYFGQRFLRGRGRRAGRRAERTVARRRHVSVGASRGDNRCPWSNPAHRPGGDDRVRGPPGCSRPTLGDVGHPPSRCASRQGCVLNRVPQYPSQIWSALQPVGCL